MPSYLVTWRIDIDAEGGEQVTWKPIGWMEYALVDADGEIKARINYAASAWWFGGRQFIERHHAERAAEKAVTK